MITRQPFSPGRLPTGLLFARASRGVWLGSLLGMCTVASSAEPATRLANLDTQPPPAQVAAQLPDAQSGECYGRVQIPAEYEIEMVDVVLQEAHDAHRITPAQFEEHTDEVVVKPAHTRIQAIQAEFKVEQQTIELVPEGSRWVRDSVKGDMILSAGERADLQSTGIDLEKVPVGACFHEVYRDPLISLIPEEVLVREASEQLSVRPAEFADDAVEITLKDAHQRIVEIPAVFRTETQRVLIEPARSSWQLGKGPVQGIDSLTDEIMRRVDVPARYEELDSQVLETAAITTTIDEPVERRQVDVKRLVSDATEVREDVPAVYGSVMKPRVDRPAAFAWVPRTSLADSDAGQPTGRVACHAKVPAVTADYERQIVAQVGHFEKQSVEAQIESVRRQILVTEAAMSVVPVPARIDRLERRTWLQDARTEWRPVLCEPDITPDLVTRLQSALAREGHSPGSIDGLLGRGTMRAVRSWQQANGMAAGGLTIDTIEALGLELQ